MRTIRLPYNLPEIPRNYKDIVRQIYTKYIKNQTLSPSLCPFCINVQTTSTVGSYEDNYLSVSTFCRICRFSVDYGQKNKTCNCRYSESFYICMCGDNKLKCQYCMDIIQCIACSAAMVTP